MILNLLQIKYINTFIEIIFTIKYIHHVYCIVKIISVYNMYMYNTYTKQTKQWHTVNNNADVRYKDDVRHADVLIFIIYLS